MSQGRHGIKVLGLSLLAALGLMAFTAAAAQAETPGEFTINGVDFEKHVAGGLASEGVAGELGAGELLVPGLNITFSCTAGKFTGTVFKGGTALAEILYEGCSVLGNNFCKTFVTKAKMETDTEPGFIKAVGKGKLLLHKGGHYLLVEEDGGPFTTIYLTKAPKGCALPLENTVTGSTVLALPNALTALESQQVDTIAQATLEMLFPTHILKYGTQTSWLDGGNATVKLSGGTLKNKPWGAR